MNTCLCSDMTITSCHPMHAWVHDSSSGWIWTILWVQTMYDNDYLVPLNIYSCILGKSAMGQVCKYRKSSLSFARYPHIKCHIKLVSQDASFSSKWLPFSANQLDYLLTICPINASLVAADLWLAWYVMALQLFLSVESGYSSSSTYI